MSLVVRLVLLISMSVSAFGQTTIYWKKDHIYNGPGGKEIAVVMPQPTDQTAPTPPTLGSSPTVTATSVSLTWSGGSDAGGSGLAGFKIYRQQGTGANLPVGTVTGSTSFTDHPLTPSTSYTYTVVAFDNAENHSVASNSVSVTTSAAPADTVAPSTPTGFQAQSLTWSSVQLSWNPSVDTGGSGLANYRVYRNGTLIGSPTTTTLTDSGLSATTAYSYTVSAIDHANNLSGSASLSFTTPRQLVFTDNFNRVDSIGSLNSSNWNANGAGYWGIVAGRADLPTYFATLYGPGWAFAYAAQSQTHFKATALVYAPSYYNMAGIAFWASGPASYRAYIYTSSSIRLSYFDTSGTEHYLNAASLTGSGPWTLAVQADDASRVLTVFINGVQQFAFTETDNTRANSGYVGVAGYMSTSSPVVDDTIDNFILEK
jgi:chitodextrinase